MQKKSNHPEKKHKKHSSSSEKSEPQKKSTKSTMVLLKTLTMIPAHVLNYGTIFIPFSMTNFNIQVENNEFFVHINKKICRSDNRCSKTLYVA